MTVGTGPRHRFDSGGGRLAKGPPTPVILSATVSFWRGFAAFRYGATRRPASKPSGILDYPTAQYQEDTRFESERGSSAPSQFTEPIAAADERGCRPRNTSSNLVVPIFP